MSTTAVPDRFTTLPDEDALQATVVALEEHGFSAEAAADTGAARQALSVLGKPIRRRKPSVRSQITEREPR